MANNIAIGNNLVVAKSSQSFADLGFTTSNIEIVFSTENGNYKSWKPGRSINALVSIEANKAYVVVAKVAMDKSLYFSPPYTLLEELATFADLDAIETVGYPTFFKVASDEDKGMSNALYLLWPDGTKLWIASTELN